MDVTAGRVWRHVPAGKEPLHLGALLAFSQGRWNRQGEYAAIYTACTPDGAVRRADARGSNRFVALLHTDRIAGVRLAYGIEFARRRITGGRD